MHHHHSSTTTLITLFHYNISVFYSSSSLSFYLFHLHSHLSFSIMARSSSSTKIAVVTGGNKGIGFEICRQLASQGNITVVLAARDPKRGLEAVEKLKDLGLGDSLVFHQLDVVDSASAAAFADFINSKFGKLDILMNNAGVPGADINAEAMKAATLIEDKSTINWGEIISETYETSESAIQVNYYGIKKVTDALLPLLKLSDSPRIVNVASEIGQLKNMPNEWVKRVLSDFENLAEEKIDEIVDQYLKDAKEGSAHAKSWPMAYQLSKTTVIAYTRVLAKKLPNGKINAVCPGATKTDLNANTGFLTTEEGAESLVRLALLADDGPSGLFFIRKEVAEF